MHSRLYKACKQLVQILVTLLHVVQLGLLLLLPELIGNSAKSRYVDGTVDKRWKNSMCLDLYNSGRRAPF